MNVTAYDNANKLHVVELGSIVDGIWSGGFKRIQDRKIQVSWPDNATRPNLFDRMGRAETFQFVAGRSFGVKGVVHPIGKALQFIATHPDDVPALCNLQFTQDGQSEFLINCAITKVELQEKRGALVVFAYSITGGHWSDNSSGI